MKISKSFLTGLIKEEFEKSVKGSKGEVGSINERWMKMSGLLNEKMIDPTKGPESGEWAFDDFELWLKNTGFEKLISDDPIELMTKLAESAMHSGDGDVHEFAYQVAELYFKMFEMG
jgi:hypothetical protein